MTPNTMTASVIDGPKIKTALPGPNAKRVLAGDVIVLRPGIPTETTLEGDAEVVQVFIEPESIGRVATQTVKNTPQNTKNHFPHSARPNQRMTIGTKAMGGIGRSN